jgi:hypothetical protein
MASPHPPVLLTPAEEEMRVVLRALFGRLLRMDPARYSPLYVGPVRRREAVLRALREAAAIHGVAVVEAREPFGSLPGDAVAFVALGDLRSRVPTSGRWVIAGDVEPDRLPPPLLAELEAEGLIYDTRQVPSPPPAGSPLGRALAEQASSEGAWTLEVSADAESATVVAAEAAVRLRILGFGVGAVWEAGSDARLEACPFPGSERPAAVVLLTGALSSGSAAALVRRARERGAALVLVGPAAAFAGFGVEGTAGSAGVVRVGPDPVPDAVRRACWPPAKEVLTGAPEAGAPRELISLVDARHRSLNHIVRSAASWERAGFLLVYGADRFGWIWIDGGDGVVLGAWRLGDDVSAMSIEDVLSRVRAMSLWDGVRALFVAATEPVPSAAPGVGVLVDTIDLDVRRTLDEVRHQRPGGGGALGQHAVAPGRVARELLVWGQAGPAQELLQAAERASPWGEEELLLLAYLTAERNPREASARLHHAAHRLADDLAGPRWGMHVDATLSALLLDVRARPSQAAHAWGVVERWLESQGDSWVSTARRAAVAYELAARAGAMQRAAQFRDLVLQLSEPGDTLPAWVSSSDPLMHAGTP